MGEPGWRRRATGGALLKRIKRGCAIAVLLMAAGSQAARADEGGTSFWLPGFFGSLAATPQVPGWNWTNIYYHTSVSAGADIAFARQVSIGHLTVPFTGQINGHLDATANLGIAIPQYAFATPVLGGQAAVSMLMRVGNSRASGDSTLTASAGPLGFSGRRRPHG